METEKVCVNLPAYELGKIDVLVAQGLYSSRTDLIRAGIRSLIDDNTESVRVIDALSPRIGYQLLTKTELHGVKATHRKLRLVVVGVLRIQSSVTPALADETVEEIRIFGSVKGPQEVIDRLGPRIVKGLT